MYAVRARLNSIASPKACSASELESVVAPKVIPTRNSPTVRGGAHFFIVKTVYAVIRLKIPRTGMCGGAAELSIAK